MKFLTAEWRYLAMLNYAIDPAVLQAYVPRGTELDSYDGVTYASIVGFHFREARVRGLVFPFHRHFEEVNLRFYIRRRAPEGWRRGVVFVRELVPRWAIAFIARTFYGEPYLALPMRHCMERTPGGVRVEYGWQRRGAWESVSARGEGEPQEVVSGSVEEFITEHYWGYTAREKTCTEYQVEHPRWRIWPATESHFTADVAQLYGPAFVDALACTPRSAFIAEGSTVSVNWKARLPLGD